MAVEKRDVNPPSNHGDRRAVMKCLWVACFVLASFFRPVSTGHAQENRLGPEIPGDWQIHHDARVYTECGGWIRNMTEFRDILNNDCSSDPREKDAYFKDKIGEITFFSFERNTPPLELRHLESFPNLRILAIFDGRRLSESAWGDIAKIENLVALIVPTAKMKDEDLRALRALEDLRILDISMSDVTDASIEILSKFRNLRVLNISGTRMTLRGGERLRGMLPQCTVSFYPPIYGPRSQSSWAPYIRELESEDEDDCK